MYEQFKERNRIILERLESGDTLQTIANDYDLTRERIRQIGGKHGVLSMRSHPKVRERRQAELIVMRAAAEKKAQRRADEEKLILEARRLVEKEGVSIEQAIRKLGIPSKYRPRINAERWETRFGRHRRGKYAAEIIRRAAAGESGARIIAEMAATGQHVTYTLIQRVLQLADAPPLSVTSNRQWGKAARFKPVHAWIDPKLADTIHLGSSPGGSRVSRDDIRKMIELFNEGTHTRREIADRVGMAWRNVCYLIGRLTLLQTREAVATFTEAVA